MDHDVRWVKSSRSGSDSNCVEVARIGSETGLRDSKAPHAGSLAVPAASFASLLAVTKQS